MHAKLLHSRPTLCNAVDCSLPWDSLSMGFPRQEYWSELPFPSPSDLPNPFIQSGTPALAGGFLSHGAVTTMCACMLSRFSRVWLCATPWTVALQAPLSMGFSWQAYWSGLLCLLQGIFPISLKCPALAGGFFTTSATWEAQRLVLVFNSVFFSLSYSGELRRWERE